MWLRLCACVVPAAGWSLAGLLFAHSTGFGHLWTKVAICCYEKNRHPELCHLVPLKVAGKLDLGAAACSHYGTYCSDL